MTEAVIGLGANLGDPRAALKAAVAALAAHPHVRVVGVSGLWRTAAVGGPDQPEYLNAVVLVETTLSASDLLSLAQEIERAGGRARTVRWGPRTIDVDLLAHGQQASADPDLTLPHPRAHQRLFVLAPWAQVAPDWVLAPASGEPARTVAEWAGAMAAQEVRLDDGGPWWQ